MTENVFDQMCQEWYDSEAAKMAENEGSNVRLLNVLTPALRENVEKAMYAVGTASYSTKLEIVRELPPKLLKDPYYGFFCETRGNDQWIYLTVKTKRWIRFKA